MILEAPYTTQPFLFYAHKELVGGFNPFEKYESKWESSTKFRVNILNIGNHHLGNHPSFSEHPSHKNKRVDIQRR